MTWLSSVTNFTVYAIFACSYSGMQARGILKEPGSYTSPMLVHEPVNKITSFYQALGSTC